MKERPILFSGPMVHAILDGRKTQTRRLLGPRVGVYTNDSAPNKAADLVPLDRDGDPCDGEVRCPYGAPGDRLWVRETWARLTGNGHRFVYRADGEDPRTGWEGVPAEQRPRMTWFPSIHMPRSASRILLEVTDVRVERLQAISEEDARAEGIERSTDERWPWRNYDPADDGAPFVHATTSFQSLWSSINGPESWASNPWVWVVSFRRLDAPRAQLEHEATIVPQEASLS